MLVPSGRFRGTEVIDATRKHLEPEELRKVFAAPAIAARPFWNAYFRLQYYYGCRISEPAILFREDVSLESNQLIVRRLKKRQWGSKSVLDEQGKKVRVKDEDNKLGDGYTEHVYSLPPALRAVLAPHMGKLEDSLNPWLFPSPKKPRKETAADRMVLIRRTGSFSAISRHAAEKVFLAAAEHADVPVTLRHSHSLRHTRATLLLAEGVAEEDVKYLLGHASLSTTKRYLGVAKSLRLRLHTTAQLGLGDGW